MLEASRSGVGSDNESSHGIKHCSDLELYLEFSKSISVIRLLSQSKIAFVGTKLNCSW